MRSDAANHEEEKDAEGGSNQQAKDALHYVSSWSFNCSYLLEREAAAVVGLLWWFVRPLRKKHHEEKAHQASLVPLTWADPLPCARYPWRPRQ
jgi:hypothetical protein